MNAAWHSSWFYWAVGIAIGFPVGLILLTELHQTLVRRNSRLARQVGLLRNYMLPLAALLLLLVKASQVPAGAVTVRLLTTVLAFLVLVVLLSGINTTVNSQTFGEVTSVGSMRKLTMVARFRF